MYMYIFTYIYIYACTCTMSTSSQNKHIVDDVTMHAVQIMLTFTNTLRIPQQCFAHTLVVSYMYPTHEEMPV